MKLSKVLFKQHIGRQTRKNWYADGKVTVRDTLSEKALKKYNVEIVDPQDIVNPKRPLLDFSQFNFNFEKPLPLDNTHPDWKEQECLTFKDNELLVEGLLQAQLITKTSVFENTLPDSVEALVQDIKQDTHEIVKRTIESSVIFDAQQEKLPKLKDPIRYFYNFPRVYGITDLRKIFNLSKRFLHLCGCLSGPEISNSRSIMDNTLLCFPFEKQFELYEFLQTMDVMVMSKNSLKPAEQINKKDHNSLVLPNISPMHHSIGLTREHFYNFENLYPIVSGYNKNNVHTIFIFNDPTKVKNKTELAVKENQIFGRALIKAFTAAACTARQKYGLDVKEMPEPITVQCIHSDGKSFYFSVYQLNTLNLEGEDGIKNYCWTLPKIELYETAGYVDGIPKLEGYNPEVFKRILAFYKNN